jgi:taurine dioxygenase
LTLAGLKFTIDCEGKAVEKTRMATVATLDLSVEKLTPVIGAEVKGIDLRHTLDPLSIDAIRQAWYQHTMLLIRGQDISEQEQVRFGEYFGVLGQVIKRRTAMVDHHPSVMFISNIRENGELIGTLPDGEVYFHSDHCFVARPPAGTMLYAIEVPSCGGNTVFANMYAAYDSLPQAVKDRLEGLRALNVYDLRGAPAARMDFIPPNAASYVHPVVRVHPVTNRKALYVNRLMTYKIEGFADAESKNLLNDLFDYQEQRQFIYEHVWKPGDIILWDNRCTLHARTDFGASERRLLRRITLASDGSE